MTPILNISMVLNGALGFSPWYYSHKRCSNCSWLKLLRYIAAGTQPKLNVWKWFAWCSGYHMNVMHINLGRLSIRISFCFLKEINYPGDYFTGISRFLPNLRKFVFVISVLISDPQSIFRSLFSLVLIQNENNSIFW